MKSGPMLLLAGLLGLLAAVSSGTREARGQEELRCIGISTIDHTEVINDQTIAFFLDGGRIYLNQLDRACRNLERNRPFSYSTSTGQLCAVDTITVIEDFGGGGRTSAPPAASVNSL